jgi:hypothetical protein
VEVERMTIGSFEKTIDENAGSLLRKHYCGEIERAIKNAKRTAWDKWFRRQWYRAGAKREGRGRRVDEEPRRVTLRRLS